MNDENYLRIQILEYLRSFRQSQCKIELPEFHEFLDQIREIIENSNDLNEKLFFQQRITLLELFIAQSCNN